VKRRQRADVDVPQELLTFAADDWPGFEGVLAAYRKWCCARVEFAEAHGRLGALSEVGVWTQNYEKRAAATRLAIQRGEFPANGRDSA
jgi:hypothetical protein